MCKTYSIPFPKSAQGPFSPQLGREYEVAGGAGVYYKGCLYTGVWLSLNGAAWAGPIIRDAHGEFVAISLGDDHCLAANPQWANGIIREIPGVGQPNMDDPNSPYLPDDITRWNEALWRLIDGSGLLTSGTLTTFVAELTALTRNMDHRGVPAGWLPIVLYNPQLVQLIKAS